MWHRRHFVVFQPLSPSFFAVVFRLVVFKKKCFVVLGEPEDQKKGEKSRTRLFSTFFSFFFVCCMAGGLAAGRWRLN